MRPKIRRIWRMCPLPGAIGRVKRNGRTAQDRSARSSGEQGTCERASADVHISESKDNSEMRTKNHRSSCQAATGFLLRRTVEDSGRARNKGLGDAREHHRVRSAATDNARLVIARESNARLSSARQNEHMWASRSGVSALRIDMVVLEKDEALPPRCRVASSNTADPVFLR